MTSASHVQTYTHTHTVVGYEKEKGLQSNRAFWLKVAAFNSLKASKASTNMMKVEGLI